MKKRFIFILFFSVIIIFPNFAQVKVNDGISVEVNINLPISDIVLERRNTKKQSPRPRRGRSIVIHRCDHSCNHNFGSIFNQNGSNEEYMYQVTNASLIPSENGEDHIVYDLDTGDILELIIVTSNYNYNDYNYQHYDPNNSDLLQENIILAITFNGKEIPLHKGNLSLQPQGVGAFHSVINLHSINEGDFSGTVNF